jgi:L-ascorbate metabolism protein UlaG (beta-lactamase superfamily)
MLAGAARTYVNRYAVAPGRRAVVFTTNDSGFAAAVDLADAGVQVRTVHEGDELDLGVPVKVLGSRHGVIHPELPVVPNVGYLVGGRLFHPGDAFTELEAPVQVLAVPAGAPWLKLAEAVDYLRAVRPRVAVPVHERVLSDLGRSIHYRQLEQLGAGGGTTLRVLDDGRPVELP